MGRVGQWARAVLVVPDPPAERGVRPWLGWGGRALAGVPAASGSRGVRFARFVQGQLVRLALLVLFLVVLTEALVRGSLPKLDGSADLPGLSAPVTVERDGLGVPTVTAANRTDLAAG